MRLIDVNEAIINFGFEWDDIPPTREEFVRFLKKQPTVDAVPVVRGEWVVDECDTTDDVPNFVWIDFHCSECNTDYGLEEGQYGWCRYEKIPYQYCPNCGAKMESEGERSCES